MTEQDIMRAVGLVLQRIGTEMASQAPTATPQPTREPRFLPVTAYASSRGYSASTVRSWVGMGLPVVKAGRGVRIDAAMADQWLRAGGAAGAGRRAARRCDA
jgi:hypothetical protein